MRRLITIGFCAALSACGVTTPMIKSDTMSFDEVIEDTTNKLMLVNVLRARDKAPLHFADIPLLRESITQSASASWLNFFGRLANTTQRDNVSLGTTFQRTPAFDLNHLDSKEFNTGIASPIDPKIVKYWLDRGLDRRIVLLLFFSAAEIIETASENGPMNTIRVMNSPRDAVPIIRDRERVAEDEALRCDTQADFERYLKLLNALSTFFAHSYKERRVLATGLRLDETDARNLQRFAALDQTKVQLVYDRGTSAYNLYALSPEPKVAFCFYENNTSAEFINAGAAGVASRRSCFQSIVDSPAEDSTRPQPSELPVFFSGPATVTKPSRYCEIYNRFIGVGPLEKRGEYPKQQLRLHIRSVGEIFQFLGDLLHYQDEVKEHLAKHAGANLRLNTPVTFGFCGDRPSPGCSDVFMRLDGNACNVRFALTYREKEYRVANFDPPADSSCPPVTTTYKDHTLEILSVLHQLIGLNKSAAEVRTTPFVQVVP